MRAWIPVMIAACGGHGKPVPDAQIGCVDHGTRAGTGRFAPAAYYVTGENPYAIAVADFNGDCAPDVAVAHFLASDGVSSAGVGVFLNNGDGTFAKDVLYPIGAGVDVLSADLNGDGASDLLVDQGAQATALLNRGDGTFATGPSTTATGPLVIADFDEDGTPDLVASTSSARAAAVLHGNGDGSFAPPGTPLATPGSFFASLAADLDGDGHVDLVGTIEVGQPVQSQLAVLRGHGDGTFEPAIAYQCSTSITAGVAKDLDGDGGLDLAFVGCNGLLDVWRGTGGGAFAEVGTNTGQTADTVGLAAGDLDGDGLPDLAVADRTNTNPRPAPDNQLSWFHNTGGGFAPFTSISVGTQPSDIAIADVDGDGRLDLISPNAAGMVLAVVRGAP